MSDQSPRVEPLPQIEPQYLQAVVLQASQLNTLVWQKMALIFAVQSAIIVGAYFLRGSLLSWITLLIGALFCAGIVFSIHSDLKGRMALLSQANHIGQRLLRLPSEGIHMSLEPYSGWTLRPHWTFWRLAILFAVDVLAAFAFNIPYFEELTNGYLSMPLLPSR
ncbi:hypothetical protein [Bradyrhizobium elkanii]|uniref:hypothetical protein n=1 Tax=Bradyrhizobium elkanii TaxID=29448 RepID=UPI0020A0DA89|nr:hypothetical protein [Bradyrhizobium elkanii]MCP1926393.1 hypothetical protein [Bradyrhizobium elkanii]